MWARQKSSGLGVDGCGALTKNVFSSRVMKVAKKFLDQGHKLSFAVANKASNQHALSEFGLGDSEEPIVTIRTAKGVKYAMKEKFS